MTLDILSTGALIEGVNVLTTSASNVILDASSSSFIKFVGSESQIVVLPNAQTCLNGHHFFIINKSSLELNVLYEDNSNFISISPNKYQNIRLFDNSTSNGVWEDSLFGSITGDLQACYDLGNTIITESGKSVEITGTGKLQVTGNIFTDFIKASGNIIFKLGSNSCFVLDSVGSPTENIPRYNNSGIELQTLKASLSQIGSGTLGTILGGANNTASGGTVLGGKDNKTSGSYSNSIIAGSENYSAVDFSSIIGGYKNNIIGYNIILGGAENTTGGSAGGYKNYFSTTLGSFILGGRNLFFGGVNSVIVGGAVDYNFYSFYSDRCVILGGSTNAQLSDNSIVCGFVGIDTTSCDFGIGNNYLLADTRSLYDPDVDPLSIEENGYSLGFLAKSDTCSMHVGNQQSYLRYSAFYYTSDYDGSVSPYFYTPEDREGTLFSRWVAVKNGEIFNGLKVKFINLIESQYTPDQIFYVVNRNTNEYQLSLTKNGTAISLDDESGHTTVQIVQDNRLYLHTINTNHQSAAVSLSAPTDLIDDVNYILPDSVGGKNLFLATDGIENLDWQYKGFTSTTSIPITAAGDLITNTLFANTLNDGDVIEICGYGTNASAENITVVVKIGGNVIYSLTTSDTDWVLPTIRFIYSSADNKLKTLIYQSGVENINFDRTISNEIKITQTTSFNITLENIFFNVLRS